MAGYVSPERKALQTKGAIFIIVGLVTSIGARVLGLVLTTGTNDSPTDMNPILAIFILIASIVGLVCWFIGLSAYARSKGYSSWYSLLGLLSCIGLIILAVLPDRWVEAQSSDYGPGDYPRPNG